MKTDGSYALRKKKVGSAIKDCIFVCEHEAQSKIIQNLVS
jgi:hypothetical protein